MHQFSFQKLLFGDSIWHRVGQSLLFVYVCFALIIFVLADSMIFLPQPASYKDAKDIIKLPIAKTDRISATYLPNPQAKYTLLYIHGNAEDLGYVRPQLDRLHSWGFSVFAYDYRGYGTSSGKPSETNAYEDANAAYTYLTQQLKIPADRIIVYGRSVGGGSATELASKNTVAGLILESTFTSAFRVVVPFPLLPFDKFSNLDKISKVRAPVLIMHGKSDEVIPFDHGRSLYEAAPQPKMSLWVANAGHNNFTDVAGTRHQQALLSFQQLLETRK
ncbi:alpha/beta hydrolase [Chamaesiphon polymorphus]|uniref:Alpha/beta hydrolase n=1 Tax=Chamaesiphon polymorphus CCALA 037 TaxID=2107692 RepID=A0A2T1FSU7_9CYAN|nr:alpha/beta hydrolase [Chamaesiphon polymorphus]PSB48020.1 alpha/beta hydrolase [Chamaesiphon polymorphus CCALA 037]